MIRMYALSFNKNKWNELKDLMMSDEENIKTISEKGVIIEYKRIYRKVAFSIAFCYVGTAVMFVLSTLTSGYEFAMPYYFQVIGTK